MADGDNICCLLIMFSAAFVEVIVCSMYYPASTFVLEIACMSQHMTYDAYLCIEGRIGQIDPVEMLLSVDANLVNPSSGKH